MASRIFDDLPYDLLTIGNHELYDYNVALDVHTNLAKTFGGKYLTSNVYIKPLDKSKVPIGAQVRHFKTSNGRSVTAFGVLFNFKGSQDADKLFVTNPADMVGERWFENAINMPADLFIIPGHMPVKKGDMDNQWQVIYDKIRTVTIHTYTPIIFLGGHSHIRYCETKGDYSMLLQSGRYMETIGVKLPASKNVVDKPSFSRRYLDANTITYEFHTKQKGKDFHTTLGNTVSDKLTVLADKFNLSTVYGIAPHDYTINQKKFTEEGNLVRLWIKEALPYSLSNDPNKKGTNPNILIITNSNSQRFDLYSGPFTKNDQLSASFYTDKFLFLPNIKRSVAQDVLRQLSPPHTNKIRTIEEQDFENDIEYVDARYRDWLRGMQEYGDIEKRDSSDLTLGYVTTDACGGGAGDGDDTLHQKVPYIDLPGIINSDIPTQGDTLDLIFLDYVWSQRRSGNILQIINSVQTEKKYTKNDAKVYSDIVSNDAIRIYAQAKWKPTEN